MEALALCPHCGIDLEKRSDTTIGELTASLYGDTFWKGVRVKLSECESEIVQALARSPNRYILPEALLNIIDSESETNTIQVLVHRIRAKFMAIDPAFNRIESRRGHAQSGYRWLTA